MRQHFIPITKKARYFAVGDPLAKKLLIVLHGYGQLTEFFIQKFDYLNQMGYYVIAPEGTHRFYLRGSSGRVGASWMSRELRENDIHENSMYLNRLLELLLEKNSYDEISILGFSQGAATAARWMHSEEMKLLAGKGRLKHFILWASVFPPDIRYQDADLTGVNKSFVLGREDEFYDTEQQKEIIEFYEKMNFSIFQFEGKHDIDQKVVLLILK